MTLTPEQVTEVMVYWDSEGNPEGWAERITYEDGHQESGPCEWIEPDDDIDKLPDAVVEVAYGYGLDIDTHSVDIQREDGDCGVWTPTE